MLFNSINFAIFLPILFILYWTVFKGNTRGQNLLLLAGSYLFYGWWDWRFLILLFAISAANYLLALRIQHAGQQRSRKGLFYAGLFLNLGTLVFFKYFNFFSDGFIQLAALFGLKADPLSVNIILPVGISFYIFLSLSYLMDVYRSKMAAVTGFADALLSLSFFPIILAGPIHRPIGLIPQIRAPRTFDYGRMADGLRQILWGLFMKVVIADNCAATANGIFDNALQYNGSTLLTGLFFFTIQIYADFAGYSNMAIGIGKLLGFDIMINFAYPYFARDIKEFWKRWNISLTTWFRDYVFLPIAYSVSRRLKQERVAGVKTEFIIYLAGIAVTWLLTGLWHGANYTFILWGLVNGFFLVLNHALAKPRKHLLQRLHIRHNNPLLTAYDLLATFAIAMFAWVFFRAADVGQAFSFLSGIFSPSLFSAPAFERMGSALVTGGLVLVFLAIEWVGKSQPYAIAGLGATAGRPLRWAAYYSLLLAIFLFSGTEQQFIYFQF